MITVDFLISFGYCKKYYFELRQGRTDMLSYSKDDINKISEFRADQGEDKQAVRQELQQYNAGVRDEADQWARGIIQLMADAMNRSGLSEEQVREQYRS